jgi:hypothetical protein
MAQADQTIQNATFPTVRADINNNLAALFSSNSGNTAPSVTVAFQDWIDTSGTNPVWKKRNAANNAWITLGTIVGNTVAFEGTLPDQTGNAGEYLTTNGTVASWAAITTTGQLLRAPQILTSGTSYTAPANCTAIYVETVGGGGGGGGTNGAGAGGGGGAGGYCAKYFAVTASVTYSYAIGAGGTGGPSGIGSGSAGGNTTFTVGATTITAGGGSGSGNESAGGAGGTCTNGDMNITGSGGGGGGSTINPLASGAGGSSFFGGAAPGKHPTSGGNAGSAGSSGSGGSGGASTSSSIGGGAGGNGLIRIWEYS